VAKRSEQIRRLAERRRSINTPVGLADFLVACASAEDTVGSGFTPDDVSRSLGLGGLTAREEVGEVTVQKAAAPSPPPKPASPERPRRPQPQPFSPPTPPPALRRKPQEVWVDRVGTGRFESPEPKAEPLDLSSLEPVPTPIPAPLFSPLLQRGLILDLVARWGPGSEIDVVRLVDQLACGRPIATLPRVSRRRLSAGLLLLVDHDTAMQPYGWDVMAFEEALGRTLPTGLVTTVDTSGAPATRAKDGDPYERPWAQELLTVPGRPILALTTAGLGVGSRIDDAYRPDAWRRFGHMAQGAGVRLTLLSPLSLTPRVAKELRGLDVISWDRSTVRLRQPGLGLQGGAQ